jgi:hypothetical protein
MEIEDPAAVNPVREVYLREIKEQITTMLEELPPRHQAVLRLRFGLDGGKEHTLESIGARLHISRERVRQIQTEAIERIASLAGLARPRPLAVGNQRAVGTQRPVGTPRRAAPRQAVPARAARPVAPPRSARHREKVTAKIGAKLARPQARPRGRAPVASRRAV